MITEAEISVLHDRAHGMSRSQQIAMAKEFCDEALLFAVMDRLNDRKRIIASLEEISKTQIDPITTLLGKEPKDEDFVEREVEKYEII